MHAFFCKNIGEEGEFVSLERTESDHLFKTLRGRVGEQVMLLDGNGTTAIAEIMEKRELKILTVTLHEKPSKDIFLFIAAPRKQKLDQIFKQATELGVTAIAIIRCEYSVALPEGSSRWDAMLLEACKQSNNPFLPQVLPVMKFQEAIDFVEKNSMLGVFGDMVDNQTALSVSDCEKIAFFVGPEGGFSDSELALMRSKNFCGLNLGPYILRSETAAICGVAVIRKIFA
ncbi:MAG: 16S rRNA (uracil(1498)-N(3))-methyltransferase [Lentisphaeria bacterium]|nr:16S rRNA (uracil(1498)-N(3))-methyltransferase [Lentisphaeria bacterium]